MIFIEFSSIISLTIGNSAALASIDGPYNWTFDAAVTQINCRVLTNFYSVLPSAGGKRIGRRRINKRPGIPLASIPPLATNENEGKKNISNSLGATFLRPVINQMFQKNTAMPSLLLATTMAFLPARIPIPSPKNIDSKGTGPDRRVVSQKPFHPPEFNGRRWPMGRRTERMRTCRPWNAILSADLW